MPDWFHLEVSMGEAVVGLLLLALVISHIRLDGRVSHVESFLSSRFPVLSSVKERLTPPERPRR